MSLLSSFNILIFIVISIQVLSVFGEKQKRNDDDDDDDDMCRSINHVLCVKTVLINIGKSAKDIKHIANQIERHIFEQEQKVNLDTLNEYINNTMNHIQSDLPTSKYHQQFLNVNNINKNNLIDLIKEENNAIIYLYNSIKNLLKFENIFNHLTNQMFEKILNNLKNKILCNYRNIFYVYSERSLSINHINGIDLFKTRKHYAPSLIHKTYSIIITRLLNQWMKHIHDFTNNIQTKLLQ